MCGIIACRTPGAAAPTLVRALRLLEYRGYDSIGVAIRSRSGGLAVVRSVRRVDDLQQRLLAAEEDTGGTIGIGHTRWATHGAVTERNAHPHRDCTGRVALVHNGIIENADELRDELRGAGHEFASEVDTEVVCHLIEDALGAGDDLVGALGSAVARLQGTWAIVALDAATGQMAATADGSPLVVGRSSAGTFAASDVAAVADWVDEVIPLRPGDLVELGDELAWSRNGAVTAAPAAVDARPGRRELQPIDFDDFMAKEIAEQPAVAARILDELRPAIADGSLWRRLDLPPFERVAVLGCGTSLNAGAVIARVFTRLGGVPSERLVASEAAEAALSPGTLVLAISQSGETADVLRALDELPPTAPVLAVTNNPHSTLGRRSTSLVPCLAGPEVGVAATKTFTAQVLTGVCVALSALAADGRLERVAAHTLLARLDETPARLTRALEIANTLVPLLVSQTLQATGFLFLGRGGGVAYAAEGALKLKELSYRWAEAYPAGELKHGPLALVEPGTPVVAVQDGARRLAGNLAEVAARGAEVITIGSADSSIPVLAAEADGVPADVPWGPLEAVIPLQLIARELALALGRDVDKPRNLAKAVTVD